LSSVLGKEKIDGIGRIKNLIVKKEIGNVSGPFYHHNYDTTVPIIYF